MKFKGNEYFDEEEMENLVGFFEVLYRIKYRLIGEGWKVVDGDMIPPPGYKPRKE